MRVMCCGLCVASGYRIVCIFVHCASVCYCVHWLFACCGTLSVYVIGCVAMWCVRSVCVVCMLLRVLSVCVVCVFVCRVHARVCHYARKLCVSVYVCGCVCCKSLVGFRVVCYCVCVSVVLVHVCMRSVVC